MRAHHCILALLLFTPLLSAAEILPLKGEPLKCELVSVSDSEVVFTQNGKKGTRAIKDVLKIDLRDVGKLPAGTTYSLVELTDGTQLLASKYLLKHKTVELTLLAGPTLKVPVGLVANILNNAQIEDHRTDWKSRIFNMRGKEAIVVKRETAISSIPVTLGEGDEAGTSITLAITIDGETTTRQRKLDTLHGLIFKHTLDAKATPVVCKLFDLQQDVVMVSSVTPTATGVSVTTPAGARIDYSYEQIARLDYTKGKLEYLSDLEPIKVVGRSNLDESEDPDQWHVYKDTNLIKKPLTLGGVNYRKGLALKPYAELIFDLKGDFREFEAMVGIDDGVSAAGGTVLSIEGDGKELISLTISSEDKKRFRPVTLNIKDVQKLRIVLRADGEFDTSRHLDLADAKVRKE